MEQIKKNSYSPNEMILLRQIDVNRPENSDKIATVLSEELSGGSGNVSLSRERLDHYLNLAAKRGIFQYKNFIETKKWHIKHKLGLIRLSFVIYCLFLLCYFLNIYRWNKTCWNAVGRRFESSWTCSVDHSLESLWYTVVVGVVIAFAVWAIFVISRWIYRGFYTPPKL